jgi:hypothetical protein
MLPPFIPLFPLPNVVLFPHVFLPLHIFEPRYRAMIADALAGDRIIGMVLLKPGWEDDYDGRPPVYQTGCAGLITHADRLEDGRYNIVLRGFEKFRVLEEDDRQPYRLGRVERVADPPAEKAAIRAERNRLEAMLLPILDRVGPDGRAARSMPDEDLVNAMAQYLALEPIEKQALLERDGVLNRCLSLIELLEMKTFASERPWTPGEAH